MMKKILGWLNGGRWWLCVWALVLVSCVPNTSQTVSNPSVCDPPSDKNPYLIDPNTPASQILAYPVNSNSEKLYASLEAIALKTRRWSDLVDIHLSAGDTLRITITFISPEVAQEAYLAEILYRNIFVQNFDTSSKTILGEIGNRNEFMFLVTIAATNYEDASNGNANVVQIPIDQMVLTNSAGLSVKPNHRDDNLAENIYLSRGAQSGYVAYQMGVKNKDQCDLLLDPQWNNKIVISIPGLQVNNIDYGPRTWTIESNPLFDSNMPPAAPLFSIPPDFDKNRLSPLLVPPSPHTNNLVPDATYWEDMARFIWREITLDDLK